MANKEKVAVANSKSYRKPLYSGSLGTSGFFQLYPVFYQHLTRFDSINAKGSFIARLNPLVKPTFSPGVYHFVNFFVRYKDVFPRWDQFQEETKESFPGNVLPQRVYNCPHIDFADFYAAFLNDSTYASEVNEPNTGFDISYYYNVGPTIKYYKFTPSGAIAMKLLNSLGYEFEWRNNDPRKMNILPILCLGKVYLDYYYPRAYLNLSSDTQKISAAFGVMCPDCRARISDAAGTPGRIYADALFSVLKIAGRTFFENNKFYSAWDTPMGPSVDNSIVGDFYDASLNAQESVVVNSSNYNGTPALTVDSTDMVSQNGLQLLERVTNLVKRYQASGNSIVNRVLARYGRKLTDDHRAMKLNHAIVPIKVGDVESNSFAENAFGRGHLGDLAGKSVGLGGLSLKCKSGSHAGMFLTMCSIVADAELYQGIDRMNTSVYPTSFYTPEFDRIVTAISKGEVFNSNQGENNGDPTGVFGFSSMYYHYIRDRKVLVGNFRLPTHGAVDLSAYHTFRDLNHSYGSQVDVVHDLSFLRTGYDASSFNHIFYNEKEDDQFIIDFTVKGHTYGPKAPINDQYDWGDDEGNKKVLVNGQNSDLN